MPHKVVLTPVAIIEQDEIIICIAVRDPQTQAIVGHAFTPTDLTTLTAIPYPTANTLFDNAMATATQRMADQRPA